MEGDIKQKTFLVVICFIASLFIGILVSGILIGIDLFLGELIFLASFLAFLLFGFLTYFSFSFFNIKERNIFWLMLSLGILCSLSYLSFNLLIASVFDSINFLQPVESVSSTASFFGMPSNPILPIISILISYLLLPIIFLIINKNKTE